VSKPPILILKDIALTFGGTPLLVSAELSASAGDRICLVGRNGSGKSTLLKIAAGLIEMDAGSRFVQPGATLRYLPQEPDFSGFSTVEAYVAAGLAPGDDAHRARTLLEDLGLTGEENPKRLSGGEARRAAIARTLAPDPDILLLDEPTNHLDIAAIEWLEKTLSAMKAAIVTISHDRRFLSNLSRATVWLDRGRTRRIERGFSAFEAWRDEAYAEEETARHKVDRKLAAEADWLRYGVTARRKRNVRRLGELYALREARKAMRGPAGKVEATASEAAASGAMVVEAEGLWKSYEGRPIVRDLAIRIRRGDRLGLVGPNGAGKTTLIKLLTGQIAPDAGRIKIGTNLEIATLEQGRDSLDPDKSLQETLTGGRSDSVMVNGAPRHVVSYMTDFLFAPEQARTPVSALSGGERGRLVLARALARPSNLLVLDEPTNDLDLETLDVLEDILGGYAGTVFLVSHDRDFLDRIVGSVLAPEGDGRWSEYAGGYSDMLALRGADLAGRKVGKGGKAGDGATGSGGANATGAVATATDGASSGPGSGVQGARPGKRRLSFNEQHALKTLPATMAKLEKEIAAHRKVLEDATLYARDRAKFDKVTAALTAAETALAEAEDQWLALEMLKEELAG
jgi:ATP-binding cassette subfamily F protein uup